MPSTTATTTNHQHQQHCHQQQQQQLHQHSLINTRRHLVQEQLFCSFFGRFGVPFWSILGPCWLLFSLLFWFFFRDVFLFVLGSFWRVLEGLWGVFEGILGCLGWSWAPPGIFGSSWEVLGGLGPSWVVLGRFRLNRVGWAPDLAQFGEPKRDPRWSQNATQDGPTSKIKTKSKKDALEDRLGAVLGRSWVVLGVVLGSSFLFWRGLYNGFRKFTLLRK